MCSAPLHDATGLLGSLPVGIEDKDNQGLSLLLPLVCKSEVSLSCFVKPTSHKPHCTSIGILHVEFIGDVSNLGHLLLGCRSVGEATTTAVGEVEGGLSMSLAEGPKLLQCPPPFRQP